MKKLILFLSLFCSSASFAYTAPGYLQPATTYSDSLNNISNNVNLVNDTGSPSASQYWGTNASSVRGWFNLPAGGGGGGINSFNYLNGSSVYGGTNSTLSFTGTGNMVFGTGAAPHGSFSGNNNSFAGTNAAYGITSGSGNSCWGYGCMTNISGNNYNTSIGLYSLKNVGGDGNTGLGYQALKNNTSGAYSIGIGADSGNSDAATSNQLYIGSTQSGESIDTIEVDSQNVGGAAFTKSMQFESGAIIATATTQPTCDVDHRGMMWIIQGTSDVYQICENISNIYTWVTH